MSEAHGEWSEWMFAGELSAILDFDFRTELESSGRVYRHRWKIEVQAVICTVTRRAVPHANIYRYRDELAHPRNAQEFARKVRIGAGLTQRQVGKKCGISATTVRLMETKGAGGITLDPIIKWCTGMGVDPGEYMRYAAMKEDT